MDIRIDKSKRDDKYYNKNTFEVGNTDNIIKFNNIDYDTPSNIIAELVAANLKLNTEEIKVLKLIYDNNIDCIVSYLYDEYNKLYARSYSTFNRALNKLIDKGIISVYNNKIVVINNNYVINNKDNIKYIIIKV